MEMDVVKESGSESVKKKKHKKRNYDECNVVVGGEVGSVGLDTDGTHSSKKSKIECLCDVGCNLNVDSLSKKDNNNKKKGKSGGSSEERKTEKRKTKEKERKGGDDGGVLNDVGGLDGEGIVGKGVSELNSRIQGRFCVVEGEIEDGVNNVNGIRESDESKKDKQSEKKKRKEKESKGRDDGGVLNEVDARNGEGIVGKGVSELNTRIQKKVCVVEGEIEGGEYNVNDVRESDKSVVGVAVDTEIVSGREEQVSEHRELKKAKKEKRKKDTTKAEADVNEVSGKVEPVEKKQKRKEDNKDDTENVDRPEGKKHKKERFINHVNDLKENEKSVVGGEKDPELVSAGEGHVSEHGRVKKVKKNKKSKIDFKMTEAGSDDMVDNTGFVEIQNADDVAEKGEAPVEKKKTKKKKEKITDSVEPTEGSSLKSRKVKFADTVEVLGEENVVGGSNRSEGDEDLANGGCSSEGEEEYLEDGSKSSKRKKKLEDGTDGGVVQGKRFSKEEDEIVRAAVLNYVEDNHLGEEGVEMVMKCRQHGKKLRDCWKQIAEAIPWRTKDAVYSRAHILFERGENRKWSKEELEMIREFHQKHGSKWRELADELKKHRVHVKDAFRQVKLPNKKTGQWSQEEYQSLFDLVNKDLRLKVFMEKKSKHGMLRDNIGWESISRMLSTRTDPVCCQKWYNQLTSPLVARGDWTDADDYRLLIQLVDLDATCDEDVDWDNLLDHRSGDVCHKRWKEMVRHIGEHGNKSFSEQVDILSQRYCPDVLEAREAYDSKPVVD